MRIRLAAEPAAPAGGRAPPADELARCLRSRPVAAKRPQPSPRAFARRLRSLLPVSPLPWRWSSRIAGGAVAAVAILLIGGAIASILLQGGEQPEAGAARAKAAERLQRRVGGLDAAEKAAAVVLSGFESSGQAAKLASSGSLGGLLVGAEDWFGSFKGSTLISRLDAQAARSRGAPPLIVGVQEGGPYRAYPELPPAETQATVGATGRPRLAARWSAATARALARSGFDLNLAPIADVATLDSPIADRAFGDDPRLVAAMTAAAVRGCRGSGIACAPAHFPGLGAASQGTAEGPATIGLDEASLEARDLVPFRAAIAAGAPALVLSLGLYAAYDPVTPAALSPAVATGLLRGRLGFKGVALTDDLSAGAGATGLAPDQAAVQALAAGADMVQVSDPAQAARARGAIARAARRGSIPAQRLDQAVARVLSLKRHLGLLGP